MADGRLPVFNKKIGPVRELCTAGFLHLMILYYILLLLFDNF